MLFEVKLSKLKQKTLPKELLGYLLLDITVVLLDVSVAKLDMICFKLSNHRANKKHQIWNIKIFNTFDECFDQAQNEIFESNPQWNLSIKPENLMYEYIMSVQSVIQSENLNYQNVNYTFKSANSVCQSNLKN